MNRFVVGAVACLLFVTAGLFWWQIRAERQSPVPLPAQSVTSQPESLPEGDGNATGIAPPMPPEALPEDREAKRFGRYDRNRDGIITRIEMMSSRAKEFRKLDTDGNNLLSFEEWAVKTSDRFAHADADKNGKLTKAEFAATAPPAKTRPKCKC